MQNAATTQPVMKPPSLMNLELFMNPFLYLDFLIPVTHTLKIGIFWLAFRRTLVKLPRELPLEQKSLQVSSGICAYFYG